MKANELMIGDWVLLDMNWAEDDPMYSRLDYQPYKIKLSEDFDLAEESNCIGDADAYQPIPLTQEILEKNGFKIVHGFGYSDKYPTWGWGYHNGIHDYCSIDVTFYDTPINGVSHLVKINRNSASGDGINTVHNCDIDYVHQLQHAIRLCGIEKEIEL